jgi:hypothetical protein
MILDLRIALDRAQRNVTIMSNINGVFYNQNSVSPETLNVIRHIVIGHLESELEKARDAFISL